MSRKNITRALLLTLVLTGSANAAGMRSFEPELGFFERLIQKISQIGEKLCTNTMTVPHG